jgi:AbrB family looped-hinge helix DNA binding protein
MALVGGDTQALRSCANPFDRVPEYQASCIFRQREMESAKVGKRGAIIVPARLRKKFGIEEGTLVTAEEREDGILIRPAVIVPVEKYTPERKAEFLLSTATTRPDYERARKEVRKLGIDPDSIVHHRPA